MRKVCVLGIIVMVMVTASVGYGQGGGGDQRVSPPPISSANVYAETTDIMVRAMYMDMADFLTGGGASAMFGYGLTDRLGVGVNIGLLGMVGDMSGPGYETDITAMTMPFGGVLILEVLGGNEKDAAGVITKRRPTVSLFGGLQAVFMSMTTESTYSTYSDTDVYGYAQGGVVADVPLSGWLSLAPYGSIMVGETEITSYGADIVVRPFRNAPDWQISVGTVLQQVDANDDDSTVIMVGLSYTGTRHHRRVRIGPVLE